KTTLPVIGVPIKTQTLEGLDSLLSIVQMPKGVPVATVGINNAANAALLAARILALQNNNINEKLIAYLNKMEQNIRTLELNQGIDK
ncbi:MAG: AIR carboxylase family protein, partial [Candidatus Caldatribacteriota bacterium]